MGYRHLLFLILLAAIWGASFLFMRVASPEFGPVPLIFVRVSGATIFLLPVFLKCENRRTILIHWKKLCFIGLLNSAIPFTLLSFATLSLEAGITSLLNATTPIFASIVGVVWVRLRLTGLQKAGLILAFLGVGLISAEQLSFKTSSAGVGILSGLAAALSYGISAHYTKKNLLGLPVLTVTAGSLLMGALVMILPAICIWPETSVSMSSWGCAIGLAVLCTALAYIIYYKLILQVNASFAASVTFIVPVFSVLWGWVFLHERLTIIAVAGIILTLTGTSLSIGFFDRLINRDRNEILH